MNHEFLPRRGQNSQPNFRRRPVANTNSWERPVPFRTPDSIAQEEQGTSPNSPDMSITPPSEKPKRSLKAWLKSRTKKQLVLLIAALVMVLGLIGFGVYHLWIKDDTKPVQKPAVTKKVPEPKKPEPIFSTLSGLQITDPAINQRPVTAVMIENSPDARPQSGINQASVVFEAIAEGGITRFLTLFQDTEPDYIGPVRSVRPYYVQWLAGFDAAVAHVGGSADALKLIKTLGVKDLDQFYNPGPYQRIKGRFAPHNMYSNVIALRELQTKKGYTSTFKGFERKIEAKSAAPTATSIDFAISGALYNAHFDYDPVTNAYKRSEGGKPHIDERSGAQLSPKVVVGLVLPQGSNGIYTTYNTIGSGQAFIFQDGIVTPANWHKASEKEQFTFTDAAGAPVKLNPGQTWLTAVGGANRVTYK